MPTMTPEEELAFYKKYNVQPTQSQPPVMSAPMQQPEAAPMQAPARPPGQPMATQGFWSNVLRKRERDAGM